MHIFSKIQVTKLEQAEIFSHLKVLRQCINQGSTRKQEPVGDIYLKTYCKVLAYMIIMGAGEGSSKSVGQFINKAQQEFLDRT